MRKLKHGRGVVAQNFLLNYSLFKITLNPSKKVEFLSEKALFCPLQTKYQILFRTLKSPSARLPIE